MWTAVFGAAFGWVEAAVVVYLRRIVYPDGFALPLAPIEPHLAAVELGREAATLIMLAAVAMLAGRTRWQRFAAFIVAFGVWDLAYYLVTTTADCGETPLGMDSVGTDRPALDPCPR
jgi:hypothetical protein